MLKPKKGTTGGFQLLIPTVIRSNFRKTPNSSYFIVPNRIYLFF
jgi:hypothetical protein